MDNAYFHKNKEYYEESKVDQRMDCFRIEDDYKIN